MSCSFFFSRKRKKFKVLDRYYLTAESAGRNAQTSHVVSSSLQNMERILRPGSLRILLKVPWYKSMYNLIMSIIHFSRRKVKTWQLLLYMTFPTRHVQTFGCRHILPMADRGKNLTVFFFFYSSEHRPIRREDFIFLFWFI
jgi:hypothetical protein